MVIALLVLSQSANAAVKAGDACKKAGTTATANGKKFTCVKSGKKLVWNKGVAIPKPKPVEVPTPAPTPAPTVAPVPTQTTAPLIDYSKTYSTDDGYFSEFDGPCAFDNYPPEEWREFQSYYYQTYRCIGQLKLGK